MLSLSAAIFLSGTALANPLNYFWSTNSVTKRDDALGPMTHSNAKYRRTAPIQPEPIIPFQAFGLRFDEDLMIALNGDDDWGMLEVAKVSTPVHGDIWFTLDSRKDGRQRIGLPNNDAAIDLSKHFPGTSYQANLKVKESKRDGKKTEFTVNYTREDGRPIAFKMIAKDQDAPPWSRNGNAMNHAQDQAMALMDLSSIQLTHPKWLDSSPLPVQSILFTAIAARMRQTVFGIKEGEWIQSGLSVHQDDGKWELKKMDLESKTIISKPGFPRTDYIFEKKNGFAELRRIEVHQALHGEGKAIAKMEFNPSLPDLRYGPPSETKCSVVVTEINQREGYQKGKVCIEASGEDTRVTFQSSAPAWAWERPIISWISPLGAVRSTAMTPTLPKTLEFDLKMPTEQSEIWAPEDVEFQWKKRPHRIPQMTAFPPLDDKGAQMQFKGGTWANGRFAKDDAVKSLRAMKLSNARFYVIDTPQIPLRRSLKQEHGRVEGRMRLTIDKTTLPKDLSLQAGVLGFDFQSGPQHADAGVTLKGVAFSVSVVTQNKTSIVLDVTLSQDYGNVPDRHQSIEHYSALGQLRLALIAPDSDTDFSTSTVLSSKKLEKGFFKSMQPAADGSGSPGIWKSYRLTVVDESKDQGRYWRRLHMNSSTDASADIIDNAGWITRETAIQIEKEVIWHEHLNVLSSELFIID